MRCVSVFVCSRENVHFDGAIFGRNKTRTWNLSALFYLRVCANSDYFWKFYRMYIMYSLGRSLKFYNNPFWVVGLFIRESSSVPVSCIKSL